MRRKTTAELLSDYTLPGRPDECWRWAGQTNKWGYGLITAWKDGRRTTTTAHRAAYEATHGSISRATLVRHSCDNPGCVNPSRLVAGTQVDNMKDMRERGRENKSRSGPTLGITLEAKREAVQQGLSSETIAQQFGVGLRTAMRWRQMYS